ncbi:MAG: radical SAM protein [Methylococcus sp.]
MKPSSYSEHKLETIASYQQFLERQTNPAYPLEIFLEISNVCNLKCAMCVVFSELNPHRLKILKSEDRGFLDRSLIEALHPLLSHALMVHCFGYGEPTVHPDFAELLASIARYEVLVDFFTNGMNLSEELCVFLVEQQIHKITVSFSGSTREDYENMYLNGQFETVLGGIARLNRIKIERGSRYPLIDINSIAFPHHLERIVEFVELMAARGVNTINLKPHVAYEAIPILHSHVAVMRPWVEGQWLDQAKQLAQRKGLNFVDEFSNVAAVSSPEEEEAMRARLLWGHARKTESTVSIADLKKKAKTVEPIIPPKSPRPQPLNPATAMDKTPDAIKDFLGMGVPQTTPDVMCSEPFKTLYVTQAGQVKPCCFGINTTWGTCAPRRVIPSGMASGSRRPARAFCRGITH